MDTISYAKLIEAEDRSIVQIARGIQFQVATPLAPSNAPHSALNSDVPTSQIASRRPPRNSGDRSAAQRGSSSKQKGNSSRGPPPATCFSSQASKQTRPPIVSPVHQESSNSAEPNDESLSEAIFELVRVCSSTGVSSASKGSEIESIDGNVENFHWLVSRLALRVSQEGLLSKNRHLFALLLIALHRRDERYTAISLASKSPFRVQWNSELMTQVLQMLISTIKTPFSPAAHIVHLDSLRALSMILFENARFFAQLYTPLLACLRPLCDVRNVLDKEVQRIAFNCLANMCYKSGSIGQSHYEEIWAIFMRQAAQLQPQVLTQFSFTRVFAALLRGIQFIIPEAKSLHEPGLPSLVSMLHKFIFYGTPLSNATIALGAANTASSSSVGSNSSIFNAPPSLSDGEAVSEEDDEYPVSTGSEWSGSDVYNDKHGLWKVRFHSLGCLQSIARSSTSEKFIQFWAHLLPQSAHQPSIISIIQIDPIHQVRSAACRLLSAMFDGQHAFLEISFAKPVSRVNSPSSSSNPNNNTTQPEANNSEQTGASTSHTTPKKSNQNSSTGSSPYSASSRSFTPISMQLFKMLHEVHVGLLKALTSETRQTTIIAIIKTFGVLAQETPYDSTTSAIALKVLLHLQKTILDLASSPEAQHQRLLRASISSIASCIGARVSGSEIEDFLENSNQSLIQHMESLLVSQSAVEINFSVKTEIFRFFSALASKFPLMVIPYWDALFKVILYTVTGEAALEMDPNTRHAASKVVDDMSRTLLHRLTNNHNQGDQYDVLERFTSQLWHNILNSRLTELIGKDRFGLVRSSICNLFSQIPDTIFARLSRKHQVTCITLLLGATTDDVPAVRAQAARALGVYILNSSLKVDPLFVSDVALTLASAMKDKNLNVRVKATWSAANLCDALVTLREGHKSSEANSAAEISGDSIGTLRDGDEILKKRENDGEIKDEFKKNEGEINRFSKIEDDFNQSISEDVPKETLVTLVKSLLGLCRDNDKVRCNAVRALGNFIRFASDRVFDESPISGDVESASSSSTLPKHHTPTENTTNLLQRVVDALLQLTREGSAKVRWNACYALANLFHNKFIVDTLHSSRIRAVEALLFALNTSTNFKVRINAATALYFAFSSGALENSYEQVAFIIDAVVSNLKAMEQGDENFSNFDARYHESLLEQLQTLVVGCIALLNMKEHSQAVTDACKRHEEALRDFLQKVSLRPDNDAQVELNQNENEDHEEAPSHTQLRPPTTAALRAQAQVALENLKIVSMR